MCRVAVGAPSLFPFSPAAGTLPPHLGVEKTLDRIKARLHWPGVKRAVEDYCRLPGEPAGGAKAAFPRSLNSPTYYCSYFQHYRHGPGGTTT